MIDLEKLTELQRLLDEAYEHYFQFDPYGDCKSADGAIEINLGTFFDRENPNYEPEIMIYSYAFCEEGRRVDCKSLDEALETVRRWHKRQLSRDYSKE